MCIRDSFLAGFLPALVLPYVPYLLSGGAFGSLFETGTGWTGGALLFALLAKIVDPEVARLLCLAVFLARAAGPRPGRRHLAAGRHRAGRTVPGGAGRTLAGAGATVAAARRGGGMAPMGRTPCRRESGRHRRRAPYLAHDATERAQMTPGLEPRLQQGSRVLAVMAKPLVRGAVKTRLAAQLGDDEALAVYERLLLGTLAQAELLQGTDLVLAEASADGGGVGRAARPVHDAPPGLAGPPSDPLAGRPARWRRLAQRGDTLGARLAGVFTDLFADGAAFVVAVNSDSPAIPVPYLEQAFAHLAAAPSPGRIVLGPAADGGYYLIGLDAATWKAHADSFTALLTSSPMSTASLLTYTLRAARARGLEAVQLPLWMDVDEPADLAVLARLEGDAPLRGEPIAGLREIYLHVTHRCGRDCRHCYNKDAAWDPGELTTTEWKDAIDQCVALGASSFVFIGGDPLLRDDFVELLDHITGTHQARARFFFNSHVDQATAAELSRAGRGLLRPLASIDGPRPINDELRGHGSHDDIMASMANLLAVGLEPVANTVLVRPALPGLTQLAHELRAAGLSRLHLILPHQAGGVAGATADLSLI